jgi:hypothetical protein
VQLRPYKKIAFIPFTGILVFSFLTALPAWSEVSVGAECPNLSNIIPNPNPLEKEIKAARARAPKLESLGELGLKGKAKLELGPIRNQGPEEICWGYETCEAAEAQYLRGHPNGQVDISPEYQAFGHVYFQIENHRAYFRKIADEIAALPKAQRADAMKKEAEAAYLLIKGDSRYANEARLWVPSQGSDEGVAFKEAAVLGMVPRTVFDGVRKTPEAEQAYENAIQRFIGENLFSAKELDGLEGASVNGINEKLYDKLGMRLKRYLGATPPKPSDTFLYNNKEYNAVTWMKGHLGYDPADWSALTATPETHELSLKAMVEALDQGYSPGLGMAIFGDKLPGTNINWQMLAQKTGIFSPAMCPGGKCVEIAGAHEIKAINYFKKDGKITGFVIQNSWDEIARDASGRQTRIAKKRGYFIVTADCLKQNFGVKFNWDFAVPKSVSTMPEFAKLKKEAG